MTTYTELQGRVLRMLGDPSGEVYAAEFLRDGINAALDAILPWCPKLGVTTLTGDDSTAEFSLPSGCYDVDAIVSQTSGETLRHMVFAPGSSFLDVSPYENLWVYTPDSKIKFGVAPPSGSTYEVYYLQQWTHLTSTTVLSTTIEPPDWTVIGITLYAAAYLLLPASLDTANLRQYATKVDSGNPEHNPLQKSITYLLTLFQQEMNRHPRYQRAQA
jgi:hypothetical protein